jgi:acyl carrier protein phosphodiesterase
MNWLAHVFLSEENVDFQIGNFLADPMKGKLCSRKYRYFGRRFFDFFP